MRPTFRLRSLFLIFTLLSVLLGTIGAHCFRVYQQDRAIETIRNAGGILVKNPDGEYYRSYFKGTRFDDDTLASLVPYLGRLTGLTQVDLIRCPITDKGLIKLAKLRRLEELFLMETQVTDEGTSKLKEQLPGLEIRHELPDPVATGLKSAKVFRHAITTLAMNKASQRFVAGNGHGDMMISDWSLPMSSAVSGFLTQTRAN